MVFLEWLIGIVASLLVASSASAQFEAPIIYSALTGYCGDGRVGWHESCDPGMDASCDGTCNSRPGLVSCTSSNGCFRGQSCGQSNAPLYGANSVGNVCWPADCDDYWTQHYSCGAFDKKCGACLPPPLCGDSKYCPYKCEDTCAPAQIPSCKKLCTDAATCESKYAQCQSGTYCPPACTCNDRCARGYSRTIYPSCSMPVMVCSELDYQPICYVAGTEVRPDPSCPGNATIVVECLEWETVCSPAGCSNNPPPGSCVNQEDCAEIEACASCLGCQEDCAGTACCASSYECGAGKTCASNGKCASCTSTCSQPCGNDGCGKDCGQCASGQGTCRSDIDCVAGLKCSAAGVCRPDYCDNPTLTPCANPANAGLLTECGTCPVCVGSCAGKQCGDNGCNVGVSCGATPAGQECTPAGTLIPAGSTAPFVGGRPIPVPPAGPAAPSTAVGRLPGTLSISDFGQASYEIPLRVPPGRGGIAPELTLSYSSSAENGYLGAGWGLNGLSAIQRCPKTIADDGLIAPVRFDASDRFCLDGNRLVLATTGTTYGANGVEYRTQRETFSRIVSYGSTIPGQPDYFKVWTRDGRILTFGAVVGGNQALDGSMRAPDYHPSSSATLLTQTWALSRVEDRVGNAMTIEYEPKGARVLAAPGGTAREYYPTRIVYTDHPSARATNSILFEYDNRTDLLEAYQSGVRYDRTKVLKKIKAVVVGQTIFEYRFRYQADTVTPTRPTLLAGVQQCARSSVTDTTNNTIVCTPETAFEYEDRAGTTFTAAVPSSAIPAAASDQVADFIGHPIVLDLDGNGQQDLLLPVCTNTNDSLCIATGWKVTLNGQVLSGVFDRQIDQQGLDLVPADAIAADFDLDGRDEVLELDAAYGGPVRMWEYTGTTFAPHAVSGLSVPSILPTGPYKNPTGSVLLGDVDGDGVRDLVFCSPVVQAGRFSKVTGYDWKYRLSDRAGNVAPAQSIVSNVGFGCSGASVIDIEGDGRDEVLVRKNRVVINAKTGISEPAATLVLSPLSHAYSATAIEPPAKSFARFSIDHNGDGLQDIVDIDVGLAGAVWINTGTGFVRKSFTLSLPSGAFSASTFIEKLSRYGTTYDENGDGRSDMITPLSSTSWVALRTTRSGMTVGTAIPSFGPRGANRIVVYDEDRDGVEDLAYLNSSNSPVVHRRGGAPFPRLHAATDGLGARTQVEYAAFGSPADQFDSSFGAIYSHFGAACTYPTYCGYPSGFAVRQQKLWDKPLAAQAAPTRTFVYTYYGAATDLSGRGSLGFASRTVVDKERDTLAKLLAFSGGQVVKYEYQNTATTTTGGARYYPYAGQPWRITSTTTVATGALRVATDTYTLAFSNPTVRNLYSFVDGETHTVVEGGTTLSSVSVNRSLDAYGNITYERHYTSDFDQNEVTRHFMYAADSRYAQDWLISVPQDETFRSTRATIAQRVKTYTYHEASGGQAALAYTGLPYKVATYDPDQASSRVDTTTLYDAAGNVKTSTSTAALVSTSRQTNIQYDLAWLYPTSVTDAQNHSVDVQYDVGLGLLVATKDGSKVEYSIYDGFGRPSRLIEADGNTTSMTYAAASDGYSLVTARPGAPTQTQYFDVLGRENKKQVQGFDGSTVQTVTTYDVLGRVMSVTQPMKSTVPSNQVGVTSVGYDTLDRPMVTIHPDGTSSEACYLKNVVCERNPKGETRCTVLTTHGEAGRVLDTSERPEFAALVQNQSAACLDFAQVIVGNSALGTVSPIATSTYGTEVLYGAFDVVKQVYEPGIAYLHKFGYDAYGNLLSEEDADRGIRTYAYDGFGQLVLSTDALAQATTFEYDGLGRLTRRVAQNGGAAEDTHWVWDTKYYGELSYTTTIDGERVDYEYDGIGRAREARKQIAASGATPTLTQSVTRDAQGRIDTITYPALVSHPAVSIRYGYTPTGYLNQVADAANASIVYWKQTASDNFDMPSTEVFGNGLTLTSTRDPVSGLLKKLAIPAVQQWDYTYYSTGNLWTAQNGMVGTALRSNLTYAYDALDRLTSAKNGTTTAESNSYDAAGNITQRGVTDPVSMQSVSQTYVYTDASGKQPHGVKQLMRSGVTQSYHYNANGDLDHRWGGWDPEITLQYNRLGLPTNIASSTRVLDFQYDAEGQRVRELDRPATGVTGASVETLYFNDTYYARGTVGTSGYEEHYIVSIGDKPVTEIVYAPPSYSKQLFYIHTDRLGNWDVVTNSSGQVVERDEYEAFGKRTTAPSSTRTPTIFGFTGHEHDLEFGLINTGARLYDPSTARFVSADPIVSMPWDSQGWNRYSYAQNNPSRYTDPSGLFVDCGVDACAGSGTAVTAAAAVVAVYFVYKAIDAGSLKQGYNDTKKWVGKAWHDIKDFLGFGSSKEVKRPGVARVSSAATEQSGALSSRASSAWASTSRYVDVHHNEWMNSAYDASMGWADAVSFGDARKVRMMMGTNGTVNENSTSFTVGTVASIIDPASPSVVAKASRALPRIIRGVKNLAPKLKTVFGALRGWALRAGAEGGVRAAEGLGKAALEAAERELAQRARIEVSNLSELAGEVDAARFGRALGKSTIDGRTGAKLLETVENGFTHELKIRNSPARLLGKVQDGVLTFTKYVAEGLHLPRQR